MQIIIKTPQKAEQFAMLFQHVKSLTDHINIQFETGRLYIQCMDSAHVSIMELVLPASWFDEYNVTAGVTIGLSSAMLYKILNSRDKSQQVVIELASKDSDVMQLHFTGDSKQEFDKHFELPLMAIESDLMEIPALDHQAELTLSSGHFASIVNQLQMFGDTMTIQCSEDKIMLVSQNRENGKMSVEIKIEDVSEFSIEEGSTLDLSFALHYLHNMCLYNKIAKEIALKFSENYPMQVIYDLGENASLAFFLAPKINDDE